MLNGFHVQTNTQSQADQIHIRVAATEETVRDHDTTVQQSYPTYVHNVVNGRGAEVGDNTRAAVEDARSPVQATSTASYTTNPIKLIIATSGAVGHHNQHYHHHTDDENSAMANPDTDAYGSSRGVVFGGVRGLYTLIGDSYADDGDDRQLSYDVDNLDLASLLAHHEANLLDVADDNGVVLESNRTQQSVRDDGDDDDGRMVVEIMSDSIGVGGGAVMGSVLLHGGSASDDDVEGQRDATTVKVRNEC